LFNDKYELTIIYDNIDKMNVSVASGYIHEQKLRGLFSMFVGFKFGLLYATLQLGSSLNKSTNLPTYFLFL